MNYDEAKALVDEFQALPDVDSRLSWAGYSRLPRRVSICLECGLATKRMVIPIDDLARMVQAGQDEFKTEFKGYCSKHEITDDEEDEEGEEEEE